MAAHPGEDYAVEGSVGLTVASPVQPGGRQVIIRTMLVSMSAGLLGQTPSHDFRSCGAAVCRFAERHIVSGTA